MINNKIKIWSDIPVWSKYDNNLYNKYNIIRDRVCNIIRLRKNQYGQIYIGAYHGYIDYNGKIIVKCKYTQDDARKMLDEYDLNLNRKLKLKTII